MENQKVNTRGSMVRKIGNLVCNEGGERERIQLSAVDIRPIFLWLYMRNVWGMMKAIFK